MKSQGLTLSYSKFKMLTFVEEMRLLNASYAEASNRSSNLADANEGRQKLRFFLALDFKKVGA